MVCSKDFLPFQPDVGAEEEADIRSRWEKGEPFWLTIAVNAVASLAVRVGCRSK